MSDSQGLVSELLSRLIHRGEHIAGAESCTGGLILGELTGVPGSSRGVWGGVVAYSNDAKMAILNVPPGVIAQEGAVSRATAKSMAWGIREISGAEWTFAVTGIAGPDGGTPEKPVGTVWIAWTTPDGQVDAEAFLFEGTRDRVRTATVTAALSGILHRMEDSFNA